MATPIIVSRVRSTLHRQGYQGFSQEQILETANSLNIDIDNPTPDDTKAVVKVLRESTETTSQQAEEFKIEENSINHSMLTSLPKSDTAQVPSAITQADKTEMILNQASILGIEISAQDALIMAEQITSQSSDAQEVLGEIKSFLLAYLNYRESQSQAQVTQTFEEIIGHINESNKRISASISNNLKTLATQMEEQRNHFKSSTRLALQCFAIPSTETQG